MNKEEFQRMPLIDQVNYYNEKAELGQSLSKVSKDIGINKSISAKFKRNGYELIGKQLVLKKIEAQETFFKEPQRSQDKLNPIERINVLPEIEKKPMEVIEHIKMGRPTKSNRVKANITMDSDIKQELQIYCIRNKTTLSDLLENLAKEFIKKV
jgi:hypothetical protein